MKEKICFVLIGFGVKTDLKTGRQLDLDKTYEFLIAPVFQDLGITCVRACDLPRSGVIDVKMYEYILKADIVVADISTLNANAIYELGVRHALRPYSTVVIAEKELAYPFDLNHVVITSYEHLGKDVGASEALRFHREFKKQVESILANPETDSPVYTYIPNLRPPEFTQDEIEEIMENAEQEQGVPAMVQEAERLKGDKKFAEAIALLEKARKMDPNNPLIVQRLALATYKSRQPDPVTALQNATKILEPLHPDLTNDPETLGLSGAICKRLFEETNDPGYLDKAKSFYERGFLIAKDYYNGVNLAFLYLVSASRTTVAADRTADETIARRVAARTKEIATRLTGKPDFASMQDRVWVWLTLAEIAYTEGNTEDEQRYVEAARQAGAQPFEIDSYETQRQKLAEILSHLR